jgi:PPOX class probable F420-dependent enzyme
MATMGDDEIRAFLMAGTRTGKLAVVRRDGSPMVVPIWFVLGEDGALIFNTAAESVKGRALQRDPRVSICVDDEAPPFAFVRVDGIAEVSDDLDEVRRWATVIGGRYMGSDRADEFGERNGVPGELLVRVRRTKMIGQRGVAD